jgi:hypothetical protein
MLEQIRTVDKISSLDDETMVEVEQKVLISLGINATLNGKDQSLGVFFICG